MYLRPLKSIYLKEFRMRTTYWLKAWAAGLALSISASIYGQQVGVEPPLMGWSSWNTYRVHINEPLIRKQAEALISKGLKEVGYQYINVDDGFFGYRDEQGVLHTHAERFPRGMKPLVDTIHALGLKAGIYSDAGANTCGSIWDADKHGVGVGLYGFERQDADLYFNQWGFDYIKIDYCGAGQQLELDEQERYTTIVEAIRETSKHPVSVNICRWAYPGTWVKNLARSWRISGDIGPHWGSIKTIIAKNLYLSAFAGGGHYNDMDMLEMGRGLRPEEEETHFGMWCIMSSPLLIGCDLTTLPEPTRKLLTNSELIALNQDPLGLQAYVVQHRAGGYVLVKDLLQKQGKVRAVVLYNPTDSVCHFEVSPAELELGGKMKVRDLIKRKDEARINGKLVYEVPAHGVKILRVEGEKRIERTRYEAEQAFLTDYEDLGKRRKGVAFLPLEAASGGMTVTNLGGSTTNEAQWDNVYSEQGGKYRLTISYVPAIPGKIGKSIFEISDRRIEMTVNGKRYTWEKLETDRAKGVCQVACDIELKKGYNDIRIGSRLTWVPDLDGFTLEKIN